MRDPSSWSLCSEPGVAGTNITTSWGRYQELIARIFFFLLDSRSHGACSRWAPPWWSHSNILPTQLPWPFTTNTGKLCQTILQKEVMSSNTRTMKNSLMMKRCPLFWRISFSSMSSQKLVKTNYNHKMKKDERLIDFHTEILSGKYSLLSRATGLYWEQFHQRRRLVKTPQRYRTNKKPSQTKSAQPDLFCRVCMIARLPKEIYTSHDPGDEKCTSLSSTDKKRLSK